MIKRIVAFGIMFAIFGIPARAQATLQTSIPVPLASPQVELSPDGSTLAVYELAAIVDNEIFPGGMAIYLIDIETNELIGTLQGEQTDLPRAVAFSPDGAMLASLHSNGELIVWDVEARTVLHSYDWFPMPPLMVDFLPDGERLVVSAYHFPFAQFYIVDLAREAIVDVLRTQPETFSSFRDNYSSQLDQGAFGAATHATGPDGMLYGATPDGEVFVWDIDTRTRTSLSPASERGPQRFTVRLLKVQDDGALVFYDNELKATVVLSPDGDRTEYPFGGLAFDVLDGTLVYVDREAGSLMIADLNADSPEPRPLPVSLPEGISFVGIPALQLTPDGRLIFANYLSNGDNAVHIFALPGR